MFVWHVLLIFFFVIKSVLHNTVSVNIKYTRFDFTQSRYVMFKILHTTGSHNMDIYSILQYIYIVSLKS
jgi:hypothetical protein